MTASQSRTIDFVNARVLVIGDLMLDRFRYGAVSRISPEAPVPVVHVQRETAMLGGAGNVLANLASLDCQAGLIAVVGDDLAGEECARMIRALGCDDGLLVRSEQRRTTLKTRFISGSQQLLRCDEEDRGALSADIEDALISRFEHVIGDFNMVAVSDYAKGVLSDRVLRTIIVRCQALGIPVVVDPKRRDFSAYAGATVIKPNRSELSAFVGMPCATLPECEQAASKAMQDTGAAILLTMSEA